MQKKNRPRRFDEQSKKFISDGIAKHHFRETKGHLPRPKQEFLFDKLSARTIFMSVFQPRATLRLP